MRTMGERWELEGVEGVEGFPAPLEEGRREMESPEGFHVPVEERRGMESPEGFHVPVEERWGMESPEGFHVPLEERCSSSCVAASLGERSPDVCPVRLGGVVRGPLPSSGVTLCRVPVGG
jgi:hypothetical protein